MQSCQRRKRHILYIMVGERLGRKNNVKVADLCLLSHSVYYARCFTGSVIRGAAADA